MKNVLIFLLLFSNIGCSLSAQNDVPTIHTIEGLLLKEGTTNKFWLSLGSNTFGQQISVPLVIIKGKEDGPVLSLVAAIHGNELNGIPIIHRIINSVDPENLKGTIIAIPGLNAVSIQQDRRRFIDEEDLNRNFPGKETGNRSQQFVHKIMDRVIRHSDFLIDMHTASFGRLNSFYARADMSNDTLAQMAKLQGPDIILNSEGLPSAGLISGSSRTLRAEAFLNGIYAITVEYGNPQVFQPELIARGYDGVLRTMEWLGMIELEEMIPVPTVMTCKKSFWIYMQEGGFLEVLVDLNETVKQGQKIAIVRNGFGDIIKEYFSPEDGIVIGKSSNPANMSGGRIIHLGIL